MKMAFKNLNIYTIPLNSSPQEQEGRIADEFPQVLMWGSHSVCLSVADPIMNFPIVCSRQ